jgi:hypothetical protein
MHLVNDAGLEIHRENVGIERSCEFIVVLNVGAMPVKLRQRIHGLLIVRTSILGVGPAQESDDISFAFSQKHTAVDYVGSHSIPKVQAIPVTSTALPANRIECTLATGQERKQHHNYDDQGEDGSSAAKDLRAYQVACGFSPVRAATHGSHERILPHPDSRCASVA